MSFITTHLHCSFETLDLLAVCDFATKSSIGFKVGPKPANPLVRTVCGTIELHYPCEGNVKCNVRVSLPAQYSTKELLQAIVNDLFLAVGIAHDETFYALYTNARDPLKVGILQHQDRSGRSNMLTD